MTLRIVIDMNLSPEWADVLRRHGHDAVHWSSVGDAHADDKVIMKWARDHAHVVLTHDLDFGMALALTHATGPSVVQVRTSNPLPEVLAVRLSDVLDRHQVELAAGALVVLDERRDRVRYLPL